MKLTATLVLKEIWYRKISFLLSLLAAVAAVAICVALTTTQGGALRETKRNTRDAGSNIRIIPKTADLFEYHELGYTPHTMPEAYVDKIAGQKDISYNHLIARLAQEIKVDGKSVPLIGMAPAKSPPGHPSKSKMGYSIPQGEVYVGHNVAKLLDVEKNDKVAVFEVNTKDGSQRELRKVTEDDAANAWKVARVQPEKGTKEDTSVMALLKDVQAAFDMQGKINEIKAIDCLCLTSDENPVLALRREMEKILPETPTEPGAQVLHDSTLSDARAKQRQMQERYTPFVISTLLIVSAAWIGVLAAINVMDRTSEIGLFRALGYGSGTISSLVLGRALLIGLIGALVGWLLGSFVATTFGPELFPATAGKIKWNSELLVWALVYAPLLAMVASFIPAALAVKQDPAVTLRHE